MPAGDENKACTALNSVGTGTSTDCHKVWHGPGAVSTEWHKVGHGPGAALTERHGLGNTDQFSSAGISAVETTGRRAHKQRRGGCR